MKKQIVIVLVFVSFLVGFILGILLSNRYQTTATHQGSTIIRTDRLTGKVEYSRYNPENGGYSRYIEISK